MRRVMVVLVLGSCAVHAQEASRPRLLEAQVRIAWSSATECRVEQTFVLEPAGLEVVAHRLVLYPGARADDVTVTGREGPRLGAPPVTTGRSMMLSVSGPKTGTWRYDVTYRARVDDAWAFRCPLWLPDTPSTGALDAMAFEARLPDGSRPLPDAFPLFRWEGPLGRARTSNLPTMVRTPFTDAAHASGGLARLGAQRALDVLTLAVIAIGSAIWVWTRKRRS